MNRPPDKHRRIVCLLAADMAITHTCQPDLAGQITGVADAPVR